ncbi:MAG: bifunctional demethylmenaquinone methyltransferase/2-methoxy-6-polyprenyl-1,4-benzoquinol methylase UbiE [Chitinophagia bacterium]|nr:bifunctional demethylmenaquinone methyltransferase/2-methoxy-6-polyprenyl-1,4-benzoquinol methylase UbiE [Chitinophagia bacterium]
MNNPSTPAKVLPNKNSSQDKKIQVEEMFNNISQRYDFLNHFLSLGIDKHWRKKTIAAVAQVNPKHILDVATGTADLALQAATIAPNQITGIDIADQMLAVGKEKIAKAGLTHLIALETGDSEALRFETNTFDAVMCSFGVRNFDNLERGLKEMHRVLVPGGKLVILEFSKPEAPVIKQCYAFYFKYILPLMGRLISMHPQAYAYLPESVKAFPQGTEFKNILTNAGYKNPHSKPLTFGICTLYTAYK